MTPNDIKAALVKAGTNQSALAEYLNVSVSTVCKVINKTARSARVEKEIDAIAGKSCFAPYRKPGRVKLVWKPKATTPQVSAA
jgi:hypothetical protein